MLPRSWRPSARVASRNDLPNHMPVEVGALSVVAKVCRELAPPGVEGFQVLVLASVLVQRRARPARVVVREEIEPVRAAVDRLGHAPSVPGPGRWIYGAHAADLAEDPARARAEDRSLRL